MNYLVKKEHVCDGVINMQVVFKNEVIAEGCTITPDNTKYPFTDVYYVLEPHKRDKIIKVMQKYAA